jgi:endoglucanase
LKKALLFSIFLCALAYAGPVSYYGKLKVREGKPFIDGIKAGRENIRNVQVRGVSFGWSNTGWESERFYNANAVERMAKDWKAEIVRVAYGQNDFANMQRIKTVIDAAIENDVYIIIDWHSHSAHNQTEAAKKFFAEMAQTYGKCDGVIFEIYNEPLNVDWAGIKKYAEDVIPVIREHSDNLILVGTPNYSQKVQDVIGNAIEDPNVGYVLHFYAASHNVNNFKNNIDAAWQNNLPIFVTEYGTTSASGGQGNLYDSHNAERSNQWHSYMDSRKISSVAWHINDKYEGSAFFGTVQKGFGEEIQSIEENWTDTARMTESGKYIFKKLNCYYADSLCEQPPGVAPINVKLPQGEGEIIEVFSLQGQKITDMNLKNGAYVFIFRQNGKVRAKILNVIR